MIAIPQSVAFRFPLKAYLSIDDKTAATGKTIAIVISKNGGAFGNPSAGATNATEIGNGWYYVDLSTTDTGTLGPLIIRGTASGVDDIEQVRKVVDPHNAGFDGVPGVVAGANGGLPLGNSSGYVTVVTNNDKTGYTASTVSDKTGYSLSSGGIQAIWDALTSALTATGSIGKWIVDKLNDTITSRMATFSYTAPPTATDIRTAVGLASANLDTQLDALPTGAEIRIEMDSNSTKLANLDATMSSRSTLSQANVRTAVGLAIANLDTQLAAIPTTAPDNTSIAAIKAKTDNLPSAPAATGDAMTLTSDYDAAKTAGDATLANQTAMLTNLDTISNYLTTLPDGIWSHTPRSLTLKDGFTLDPSYDAAKTAAQPGDIPALDDIKRAMHVPTITEDESDPDVFILWQDETMAVELGRVRVNRDSGAQPIVGSLRIS